MTTLEITDHARALVKGRVVLPGDPDWETARTPWNLSVDQHPAAVVEATDVADVQAVITLATRGGLRVAPQATGHGSEALGPLDDAVLLKTASMRSVAIDPAKRIARVQAGALAADVAVAAGAHGLAPVLGLAPTVGVAGLTLGGGIGWLSRAYGLACNNVEAFTVVLASGEQLRVDADGEPDLFWALRGGGGRGAIVTAVELKTHPIGEVSAGMLAWPAEHAGDVLEQFWRLTLEAPESFSAVFRYLSLPPVEAVPAPLRGRRVVAVIATHLGTERDGARLIGTLRSSGSALLDTFAPIGVADLVRVAGDPEEPVPGRGDGFMIERIDAELVQTVADLIERDDLAPLVMLEVRQLGGALAQSPAGHGALGSLPGGFSVFASGAVIGADASQAIDAQLDALRLRLAPWITPQALLNSSRAGTDPSDGFDPETWDRLSAVRDRFDPNGLILSNREP
jgi:FAD/FMN-containing dehydrogenase